MRKKEKKKTEEQTRLRLIINCEKTQDPSQRDKLSYNWEHWQLHWEWTQTEREVI